MGIPNSTCFLRDIFTFILLHFLRFQFSKIFFQKKIYSSVGMKENLVMNECHFSPNIT